MRCGSKTESAAPEGARAGAPSPDGDPLGRPRQEVRRRQAFEPRGLAITESPVPDGSRHQDPFADAHAPAACCPRFRSRPIASGSRNLRATGSLVQRPHDGVTARLPAPPLGSASRRRIPATTAIPTRASARLARSAGPPRRRSALEVALGLSLQNVSGVYPSHAHPAGEVTGWHTLARRSAAVSLGSRWSLTCTATRHDFLASCTPSGLVAGRGAGSRPRGGLGWYLVELSGRGRTGWSGGRGEPSGRQRGNDGGRVEQRWGATGMHLARELRRCRPSSMQRGEGLRDLPVPWRCRFRLYEQRPDHMSRSAGRVSHRPVRRRRIRGRMWRSRSCPVAADTGRLPEASFGAGRGHRWVLPMRRHRQRERWQDPPGGRGPGLHHFRLQLRPVVHGRHGLPRGHVDGLLHRQLPLRRFGHQRRGRARVQRGHRQDAARVGHPQRRVPMSDLLRSVLPRRDVHDHLLLAVGHVALVRGRGRDLSREQIGRCDVHDEWAARRLRLLRRGVLLVTSMAPSPSARPTRYLPTNRP